MPEVNGLDDTSASSAPGTTSDPIGRRSGWKRWLPHDPYPIAAIAIFAILVICCWKGFVETDQEVYFLGSRRVADPGFLALDLTWSRLPPTSALFDHLIAPLWSVFDAFQIASLGDIVFWILSAWSIMFLARTIRLPAWAAVAGVALWLLWGQTLGTCGAPFEAFQPKSLAYPLMFFALAFAIRGQPLWAGMALGLGAAFHVIVGGWACLALFLSLAANRKLVPLRHVGLFLLGTAPFVLPVVLSVARFHEANVSAAVETQMDQIYTMFAMPHCCDVSYFMAPDKQPLAWVRSGVIFAIAPIVVFAWPERTAARILGGFVVALILFFGLGLVGQWLHLYGLLKVYPFQMANALPALFLFVFVLGLIGVRGASRRLGRVVWTLVIGGTLWLVYDREVPRALIEQPQFFLDAAQTYLMVGPAGEERDQLYTWIRENTPRNSVFITPLMIEFWFYAERAQVASMRHPPLDRRIIEWKERLEALNGFQPYRARGFETGKELEEHERRLSIPDLIRIRDLYGATHYLTPGVRTDLAEWLLHSDDGYSVYDVTALGDSAHRIVSMR